MNEQKTPRVLLVTTNEELSYVLAEKITSLGLSFSNCKTMQIQDDNYVHPTRAEYIIWDVYEILKRGEKLSSYVQIMLQSTAKSLLILPCFVTFEQKKEIDNLMETLSEKNLFFAYLYIPTLLNGKTTVVGHKPTVLYVTGSSNNLLTQKALSNQIVRSLFSLRAYGNGQRLIPDDSLLKPRLEKSGVYFVSSSENLLETNPNAERIYISYSDTEIDQAVQSIAGDFQQKESSNTPSDLGISHSPIIENMLSKKSVQILKKTKKNKYTKLSTPYINFRPFLQSKKRYIQTLVVSFVLFAWPYFTSLISYHLNSICIPNYTFYCSATVQINRIIANATYSYTSFVLTYIRLPYYVDSQKYSRISQYQSESIINLAKSEEGFMSIIQNISNAEELDKGIFDTIHSLDESYRSLGFVLSELSSLGKDSSESIASIENLRSTYVDKRNIATSLKELLGYSKTMTYVFLSQNTSILRPSGGKLSQAVIVSLDKGTIVSKEQYDIPELDNLLVGTVEAPTAISQYISPNWNISEANWFFSYPDSAEQILWFLEKQVDRKFDGAIVINDRFLRSLVGNSSEAEKLLDLGVSAVFQNIEMGESDKLLHGLDEKEMQIYTRLSAQESFSNMKWSGAFPSNNNCVDCIVDNIAVSEVNFGEPNQNIVREASFNVYEKDSRLEREYVYRIRNTSDKQYKVYIRLSVDDAVFEPVIVSSKSYPQDPDLSNNKVNEAGVYEVIPQDEEVSFTFRFTRKDEELRSSYEFVLYKQSGVKPYPLRLKIYPSGKQIRTELPFLTNEAVLDYNTVLSRDFSSRIFWSK